jgi:hypothetical protein
VTTIRRKTFWVMFKIFLHIFQFCINIRIEPLRTASTRFNPQRKTASTLVVYRMTFIVTDLIRVKMSRMGGNLCYSRKQPDFEPGPYGIKTVSTRFHPHRNTCQFLRILGATIRPCSKFLCVSNRVEIRFKVHRHSAKRNNSSLHFVFFQALFW